MKLSVKQSLGLGGTALLALVVAATAWPSQSARTGIKLASERPVVIAGHGFRPDERVVVKISGAGGIFRKTIKAGSDGRWSARFTRADASCGPLIASAIGSRGSRAALRRVGIAPACGIPILP